MKTPCFNGTNTCLPSMPGKVLPHSFGLSPALNKLNVLISVYRGLLIPTLIHSYMVFLASELVPFLICGAGLVILYSISFPLPGVGNVS
jgi:hypothetical protein